MRFHSLQLLRVPFCSQNLPLAELFQPDSHASLYRKLFWRHMQVSNPSLHLLDHGDRNKSGLPHPSTERWMMSVMVPGLRGPETPNACSLENHLMEFDQWKGLVVCTQGHTVSMGTLPREDSSDGPRGGHCGCAGMLGFLGAQKHDDASSCKTGLFSLHDEKYSIILQASSQERSCPRGVSAAAWKRLGLALTFYQFKCFLADKLQNESKI